MMQCRSALRWMMLALSIGLPAAGPMSVLAQAESTIAPPGRLDAYATDIAEASRRFGIPAAWIRAVMRVESGGIAQATSSKGAMGLMQILPDTWAELRTRYGLGGDPYDPHDNILAGAAYLRELLDRYGWPGFLAAYNAGPSRYDAHIANGLALPAETQAYVATLASLIGAGQVDGNMAAADPEAWRRAPLFAGQAESRQSADRSATNLQPGRNSAGGSLVDRSAIVAPADGLFVPRDKTEPLQ